MTEERLVLLIVRQLSGRLDLEGLQELHAWAAENPAKESDVDQLAAKAEKSGSRSKRGR